MIQTEKHITEGLYRKLRAAGVEVWIEDGMLLSSDDSQAQQIIDDYTVAEFIAERQAQSLAIAKGLRDKVVASVSAGEMASWSIKRAEAADYASSGNPASAPLLSAEAAARGITLTELLAKVSANSTKFAALEAAIGGIDGKHRDALGALTTWADVRDYDLTTGWPEV